MSVDQSIQTGTVGSTASRSSLSDSLKMLSMEELVSYSQSEVNGALEELIRRNRNGIFNAAYHLTRNRDAAEDVTATSCYRICRGIGGCKNPAAFPAWINRIIRNVWLDSVRGVQRRSEVTLDILETMCEEPTQEYYGNISVHKQAEANERKEILASAIAKLPNTQGRIVTLFYEEDRSYEEITEIVGIPIGTVKSRLSRARLTLRGILTQHMTALLG